MAQPKVPDGFRPVGAAKPVAAPSVVEIGHLADLLGPALDRAERRRTGQERPVTTPWPQLNETLGGGFWPGAHFLVAGTGVGKSQLTFQLVTHAAEEDVPCGLIALELDEMGLAIRIASEKAGVSWSKVYNGKASNEDMAKLRAIAPEIAKLKIRTDFGQAMGWSVDRLELMAKTLRKQKPNGPICIVLDFIQLVSQMKKDPHEKTLDLRERIGQAGYQAVNAAKTYDAAVILISSTARNNYGSLTTKLDKAGLGLEYREGKPRRAVFFPDNLIGLGKESGELEFAASSLHVLLRPPLTDGTGDDVVKELVKQGGRIIVCATPKMRAGVPSWFAMGFQKGRFVQLEEDTINSLAKTLEQSEEDEAAEAEEDASKVLECIRTSDPLNRLTSSKQIARLLKISDMRTRKAIRYLQHEKKITEPARGQGYELVAPL